MRCALLVLLLVVARPMLADDPALKPKPDAGPVAWTAGPYGYDGAGNITAIGGESFVYDKVGRLRTGTVRGPDLSTMQTQTFGYDVYGNLISTSKIGQTIPLDVDKSSNRLQGASYDASGNLTTSGAQHYAYDALGMLNAVRLGPDAPPRIIYAYTADDERLFAFDVSSGITHWTLRGLDNKVLRDFKQQGSTWSVERDYVYRDGLLLAALKSAGAVEHYTLDHLGTPRLITDAAGHKIGYHAYWPFGEEWSSGVAQEGSTLQFTGHERDADPSGGTAPLDYMHARYYGAGWGRFLSVDPSLDADKTIHEPQQWNRYSYVVNNPLKYADPDGKDKFMAWLLGEAYRDVSTWTALKGALSPHEMVAAINQGRQDWADDHRAATHGFSPVPTTRSEVAMQMVTLGPIGKFIGTSFGKLGTVVANQAGKITGISRHAVNQIITRGMSPALLKAVTSEPLVVLEQSAGQKLFLTKEGAVVLDKGGKVITAYTEKEFDQKILYVLEKAAAAK